MIRLQSIPFAMGLNDSMARFYWIDTGSRWRFNDARFMELRETMGLDSHLIHFHTPFFIDIKNGKEVIRHDPIIQFYSLADLVHFRLLL